MIFTSIKVSRSDTVATVALDRPDVKNAFDDVLVQELTRTFQDFAVDETLNAVILTGNGPVFCSGADIQWMKRSVNLTEAQNRAEALKMSEMFRALDECPKPVIGRVQGSSFGGGMGLIACCDVVVAVESAQFAFSEVRLGIVPAVIATYVLPKIGAGQARRYFLTGESFSAVEARRIGLVHEVCAPDALDGGVEKIVGQLLRSGPRAITTAKQLIPQVVGRPRADAIPYTATVSAHTRVSEEGQEGLAAFLEKRKPSWVE